MPTTTTTIGNPMSKSQANWLHRITGRNFATLTPMPRAGDVYRILENAFTWSKYAKAGDYEAAEPYANRVEKDIREQYFADFTTYELRVPKRYERV